jgi:hypothetical protein
MDRASDYESAGRRFESSRARQQKEELAGGADPFFFYIIIPQETIVVFNKKLVFVFLSSNPFRNNPNYSTLYKRIKYLNAARCHCGPEGRGNLVFHGIASSLSSSQ